MRHSGACLLLLGLVWVVYGSTLNHEFVFDDWSLVVENPVVRQSPAQMFEVLSRETNEANGITYRPVRMASYMIDHRIAGGFDPGVFHAANLIYHAAAAMMVYALAWLTIGSFSGALLAAAFFAVHPLGSEAVAYVSGRRDLLSGLFCLTALVAWWRLCQPGFSRGGVLARRGAPGQACAGGHHSRAS